MSASAALKVPLRLSSPASAAIAHRVISQTAGTSAVTVDAASGQATFGFEFPGNVDALVRRLRASGVGVGASIAAGIPVKNASGDTLDPAKLLADLKASPAVSAAAFDGVRVDVTLASATNAFRYVYEEIIINGLMPLDVPTVAYPWEFVL